MDVAILLIVFIYQIYWWINNFANSETAFVCLIYKKYLVLIHTKKTFEGNEVIWN